MVYRANVFALQALQCLVSILRSLVEWYTVSTPVVAVNDSAPAYDQSMRSDWGTLTSLTGQDPSSEAADGEAAADAEVPVPGECYHSPWGDLRTSLPLNTCAIQVLQILYESY